MGAEHGREDHVAMQSGMVWWSSPLSEDVEGVELSVLTCDDKEPPGKSEWVAQMHQACLFCAASKPKVANPNAC